MAKTECMLMFICLTSMLVNTDNAGIHDKTIERLEDQLFNIEEQLDDEARIRRYDIRAVMDKLIEIEEEITELKSSGNAVEVHEKKEAGISPANTVTHNTSLIPLLLRAFQIEKKLSRRTRRHIDSLQTEFGNMTKIISELLEYTSDVYSNVDDILKTIVDLKDSTVNEISDFINEIKLATKADTVLDKVTAMDKTVNEIRQHMKSRNKKFATCSELLKDGYTNNGLYDIYPNKRTTPIRVYCDQTTDGGGWIVFQRREDGSENFYRAWIDYKIGFGNPEWEFWLGNEYLHLLTTPCCRELRIDIEDFENNKRYVKYGKFAIGSKATNYVLTIDNYTGDAGDSLSSHNGFAFSTHNKDNDIYPIGNCATFYKGAWWYNKCHSSNLNGQYYLGSHDSYADGVNWYAWKGHHYSLKLTEMKFR